uniref:Uncharacterized protein n=2 Tax=Parascaris univalens TaxID=6257 RepID=A0A915BRH1_PARUN
VEMDDVDDGLGSEVNTPRDGRLSDQTNALLDASIAMNAPGEESRLPVTSTPRSIGRQSNIVADSFQPDLSDVHGRSLDDPFPDIGVEDAQDWAMEVVSKQEELKQLSKEHGKTLQQMNFMQNIIAELQQRIVCAEETIKDLNSERNTLLEKLERYKKSAEDNEMILARCKEELVTAQKKIAELENISLEVDVDKDAECKTIAKLLEEKEQTNMLINQIRRGAEEREKELLREKEALLSSANDERRHLAEWREKATRLDQLVIRQNAELIRYAQMEKRYTDIFKELEDERAKVSELSRELQLQNDAERKYRDEVMHLRLKLDEMKLALSSATKDSTPTKEVNRLRNECERLQIQLEADRELKAEWAVFKRNAEEMRGRLDKQENELVELRDTLNEKRKQLDALEDERNELKRKCSQLQIDLDTVNAEFRAFQNGAEMQYQTEMAQLKEMIRERDERLDRLHARIADYESFPGQLSSSELSESSSNAANKSIWEAMPEEVREELDFLKQRYKELDGVVQKMMQSYIATANESLRSRESKMLEDKATDCGDLIITTAEAHSSNATQSEQGLPMIEGRSSVEAISERTISEHAQVDTAGVSTLAHLLRSVRKAEINGKLTPNIRQLLESLLIDVNRNALSAEFMDDAVNRFFANLDLALRRTLSTSEDNRRKCEELEKARAEVAEDLRTCSEELRVAQDRYAIFEAKAESLRLQLKEENRNGTMLRNEIERLTEQLQRLDTSNTGLTGIIKQQQLEIEEKANAYHKSTALLEEFRLELEKMGAYADILNEKCRQLNRDKEELRRRLGERDREMERLQKRLVDSVQECTTRANDVQKLDKRLVGLQLQNDTLRRKYDKRETFLEQMEELLKTMKVRNDALREANRLRQTKIDVILKFLGRHGIDVGEGFDVLPQNALAEEPEGEVGAEDMPQNANEPTHTSPFLYGISNVAVARLVSRLERYTSQIEMREREGSIDDIRIPSWRSISEATSSRCASESGDTHQNADDAVPNLSENRAVNSL